MNSKQNRLIIDKIHILLRFLLSFAFLTVLLAKVDPAHTYWTLLLFPAGFFSYIISSKTRHIWSFLALHLLLFPLYGWLAPGQIIMALYWGYLLLLTAFAFYRRQKPEEEEENNSFFFLGLLFLLYLTCSLTELAGMCPLVLAIAVLYVLLYLLKMYLTNLNLFLSQDHGSVRLPYRQITLLNHSLIAFSLVLFLAVMILFSKASMVTSVGNLLLLAGKELVKLFLAFLSLFGGKDKAAAPPSASEANNWMDGLASSEPSPLMELLSRIALWVVSALLILAAVAGVVYGLYRIYRYFYEKRDPVLTDRTEFVSPFIKRERLLKPSVRERFRNAFGRSNSALIRKYFYKALISSKAFPEKLPPDSTPSRLTGYLYSETDTSPDFNPLTEKREQLAHYYEKARYGRAECAKEDLQAVKTLLK